MKTNKKTLLIALFLLCTSLYGYSSTQPGKHGKSLLDAHIDSVIIKNEHDTTKLTFTLNQ